MMKKLICVIGILSLLLTGCNNRPAELPEAMPAVIKVGNTVASAAAYEYYKSQIAIETGGTVTSDSVLQEAARQVELMTKSIALGEAMGIVIIEDYVDYLTGIVTAYGSEENYKTATKMSDAVYEFSNMAYLYQLRLAEEYKKTSGVTEETENQMLTTFFFRVKSLFLSTNGKTDEEKAQIKERIDGLFAEAEDGADFDALIAANSEDKSYVNYPDGVVFTYGDAEEKFYTGVSETEIGKYSIIETDAGYHLVKRLAMDETPELLAKFKKENISKLNNLLINPDDFTAYIDEKLKEYNLQMVYTNEQTPEPTEKSSK